MNPATAKLICLHQKESFLSAGWPAGLQTKLAQEVVSLRREIEPQFLAHYDHLKHEGKIPVVPVEAGKCQGCHANLARRFQADLRDGDEVYQCEHCTSLRSASMSDGQEAGIESLAFVQNLHFALESCARLALDGFDRQFHGYLHIPRSLSAEFAQTARWCS